jgi:hypothetical protein
MRTTKEIDVHAQDDGFTAEENSSKTASGGRGTATGEKSRETGTEECEDDRLTASRYHHSMTEEMDDTPRRLVPAKLKRSDLPPPENHR